MKGLVYSILFICACFSIKAQEALIKTNDLEFKLKEGVYLSFESFLNNSPELNYGMIKNMDSTAIANFDPMNKSYLFKSIEGLQPLQPSAIFGFSLNGTFYLKINFEKQIYYARSVNPGKLWQFAAIVTTYTTTMSFDPYFPNNYRQIPSKDLIQVVLHTEDAKIYNLEYNLMEPFFTEDPTVSKLMDGGGKRKRKKRLFYFLRKYNEANPQSFPK